MPVGRQHRAGGQLGLVERPPERAVDAHHLAGRAHLRAERRVDLGEPGERQHRLLDGDRRRRRPWQHRRHAAGPRRAARPAWRRASPASPPWPAARRSPWRRTAPCGWPAGWPRSRTPSCRSTAYCTLISPRTSRRSAIAAVYASMTSTTHDGSVCGGIAQAESPECTPASSTCSITPPISTSPVWSRTASTSTSTASCEEAVDQHRPLGRQPALAAEAAEPGQLGHRRGQLVDVVDDLHRPAAEHVARAHEHREADLVDDRQRLARGRWPCRRAAAGCAARRTARSTSRGPRRGRSTPARCRRSARPGSATPASAASGRRARRSPSAARRRRPRSRRRSR